MNALAAASSPDEQKSALKYFAIGRTDVGCKRQLNEDAWLDHSAIGLWAVADGMGGHDAGDVASTMVIDALSHVAPAVSAFALRKSVGAALEQVNARLVDLSQRRSRGAIGSTVVALLAHGDHYACLWAGDSRAYLYRDGWLRPITRDHSHVQALVDQGQLSPSEARGHPSSHVITRAVGAHAALELEIVQGGARAGDRFLLCSDGITNVLNDAELSELMQVAPMEVALDRVMQCALARGAPDNITAVLIAAEPRWR